MRDYSNLTFFASIALFIVWMQRHHRFTLVGEALEGTVKLKNQTG